jgi:hypothetical protein
MSEQQEHNGHEAEGQQSSKAPNEENRAQDDVEQIKNIVREILSEREVGGESIEPAPAEEEKVVAEAVANASTLETRKTAVETAVETARDSKAEKEIIAAAVNSASDIEARKAAVATAVRTARDENEKELVAAVVENSSTLEAKKTAAAHAVASADNGGSQQEVIEAAVKSTEGLETKKAVAAQAVNSALPENKVQVAGEAVEQLSFQQQQEVAHRFLPSREAADRIWVMIVRTFAIVLVLGMVSLVGVVGLAVFREVDKDLVQIMLTVFSTVAGILAGFITGQAVGSSSNR